MTIIKTSMKIKNNTPEELQSILDGLAKYYPDLTPARKDLIKKAYFFAEKAHIGQKRFSGEPYFMHPVAATLILMTIRPDIETICACLMHDVIEDTPITADEIEKEFGKPIRFLCEGVEKVSKVNLKNTDRGGKLETIKKLFLAVAEDIRVIFVKLADRIHNLQTLQHVRPEKKRRIARESLEIYAPVAGQLGLFVFKQMIEDLCFEHLKPKAHKMIFSEMKSYLESHVDFTEQGRQAISATLEQQGIKMLAVKGRYKNVASIYEKVKRKNLTTPKELFDLLGFRVIVENESDCYRALGAIHATWPPLAKRFKDYISSPKPNGYQSLHTTVLGFCGSKLPTEIQIRTEVMHLDAEFGPAAHWAYKTVGNSNFDEGYTRRMAWIPSQILDKTNLPADKFFNRLRKDLLQDRIYVFTPKGDAIPLKISATPVDFAYAIHTEVGHTLIGAKVNGIMRPIETPLANGDVVEILTKKGKEPNPDWLNFVKSSMARQQIQAFVNRERKKQEAEAMEFKKDSKNTRESQEALLQLKKLQTEVVKTPKLANNKSINVPDNIIRVLIGGETDIPFRMATCCGPKKPSMIVAYKSRGLDCTIHAQNCQQLSNLDQERMLDASFLEEIALFITYQKHVRGISKNTLQILSKFSTNLLSVTPVAEKQKIILEIPIQTEKKVIKGLKNLPEVNNVEEDDVC